MSTAFAEQLEVMPLVATDEADYVAARVRNHDFLVAAGEQSPLATPDRLRVDFKRRITQNRQGLLTDYGLRIQGAFIGSGGMDFYENEASAYYWIDEQHQGRGVMYTAMKLIIDEAFVLRGLDRINFVIRNVNERSQKLARRLGAVPGAVSEVDPSERLWELVCG